MKCNMCGEEAVQFVLGSTRELVIRHASEIRCERHRINIPLHQKPDMIWQWREVTQEEYIVSGVQNS